MDTQTVFRFLFMVALVFHEVNLKTPLIKPWLVSIHFCKSDDTCDRSGNNHHRLDFVPIRAIRINISGITRIPVQYSHTLKAVMITLITFLVILY